jgi:hypothetical protein
VLRPGLAQSGATSLYAILDFLGFANPKDGRRNHETGPGFKPNFTLSPTKFISLDPLYNNQTTGDWTRHRKMHGKREADG